VLRRPVTTARHQALAHRARPGATVFGVDGSYPAEWAAWANGVAVRELDYHDTFLAAEYSHPGDNIPPLVAVAQQLGVQRQRPDSRSGEWRRRTRFRSTWSRGSACTSTKSTYVAHLGPVSSGRTGHHAATRRRHDLPGDWTGRLHLTTATRQSRKGSISSWKAFAPALAGKVAIEAVDRAMRGEGSPAPIWEGEDGVIAWLPLRPLSTPSQVPLPAPGEAKRAILDSYTKEHSAEYRARHHTTWPRRSAVC